MTTFPLSFLLWLVAQSLLLALGLAFIPLGIYLALTTGLAFWVILATWVGLL